MEGCVWKEVKWPVVLRFALLVIMTAVCSFCAFGLQPVQHINCHAYMITETVREREMEWEEEKHKGNPFLKKGGIWV